MSELPPPLPPEVKDQHRFPCDQCGAGYRFDPSNGLKDYARKGRKMNGIYVPFWTYDADTKSSYVGERGQVYYETRTVMRDGKPHQERIQKVRWFPASGRVARLF